LAAADNNDDEEGKAVVVASATGFEDIDAPGHGWFKARAEVADDDAGGGGVNCREVGWNKVLLSLVSSSSSSSDVSSAPFPPHIIGEGVE